MPFAKFTGRKFRFRLLALGAIPIMLAALAGPGRPLLSDVRSMVAEAARVQRQVAAELGAGQADLVAAKTLLASAAAAHDLGRLDLAKQRIASARLHFVDAGQVVASNRLLKNASSWPVTAAYVLPRVTAVKHLSQMGITLCDAAGEAADWNLPLIRPDAHISGAERILGLFQQPGDRLQRMRADLQLARSAAAQVDPSVLSGKQQAQLATANSTMGDALAAIDEIQRLGPALLEILGANQPRTYLVLPQNPAELRPGGGFISTYGVIKADHGRLSLVGDIHELDSWTAYRASGAYFPPPIWLDFFYAGKSWKLEDSNVFPGFGANAQAAEMFADRVYKTKVDGVIAIDYYAVQSLLGVTGALDVPDYGIKVSDQNFDIQVIQRSLYRDPSHKDILGAIAKPLVGALAELPAEKWLSLAQVMNGQVASRHLQMEFHDANVQAQLARVGWSSLLNPRGAADYMFEVETNMGGSKSNYFIERSFDVALTKIGGRLHHKVTVTIDNSKQRERRSPTLMSYAAYVQMYTRDNVTGLQIYGPTWENNPIQPPEFLNLDVPAGYRLADGWLQKPVPAAFHVIFEWDTPWATNRTGRHEIYWQKQPGTLDDAISVTWQSDGRTFRAGGKLAQDRLIRLGPGGVELVAGQPASAGLPRLSLG